MVFSTYIGAGVLNVGLFFTKTNIDGLQRVQDFPLKMLRRNLASVLMCSRESIRFSVESMVQSHWSTGFRFVSFKMKVF